MKEKMKMNTLQIESYEDIKDSLRVRLMDIRRNAETLKDCIYMNVGCGLALVVYMELPGQIAEDAVANVPIGLTSGFEEVSPEGIFVDAMERSVSESRPMLCSLQDMLLSTLSGEEPENYLISEDAPEDSLLVLTTEDGRLGASALYYPGMKEKLSEIVGRDYYVLPSSVHEVLIMPVDGRMTPMELARTVRQINENEVSEQDTLCSRVLRYTADTRQLCVAADAERRMEMER